MKFEGNLAKKSMPVYDDREADISKEKGKLNLQNLALEKLERKDISGEERNASYKILFEQNPDLAMELAKKEEVFPLTALTKSGFFYFQKESSVRIVGEILGSLNSDKIKADDFKIYAPEILDWAKKNLAFEIIQNTGGTGRVVESRGNLEKLVELTEQKDEEVDNLLGKNKNADLDKHGQREDQVEISEKIFKREMEKVQDLPEGKNILYQNAKAVFSTEGETGLQKFLERHQERIGEMPPHLMLDLHYMRYAGFREFKLPKSGDSRKKTPKEIGIDAINMVKDALEKGEENYHVKAHGKNRMHRLAKALAGMLNAPGTLTEGFAFSELKRYFEKSLRERYGAKVQWEEKTDQVEPKIILNENEKQEKKKEEILKDLEIDVSKYLSIGNVENIDGEVVFTAKRDKYKWIVTTGNKLVSNEEFRSIEPLQDINGKIAFGARKQNTMMIIMTETGPVGNEEFAFVRIPQNINGKIVFDAQRQNGKWIIMTENGPVGNEEFTLVGRPQNINGKVAFQAQKENGKCIIMTENGPVGNEEFKYVADPQNINGRIAFKAEKEDGKWIVMTENGPVGNEEFEQILRVENINGRIVFQAKRQKGEWIIMTEDGPMGADEFKFVNFLTNIGERIIFQARRRDNNNLILMSENGPIGNEDFKNIGEIVDINGRVAFQAERQNGKFIVMTETGPVGNEEFKWVNKPENCNGRIYFSAIRQNGDLIVMTENGPIFKKEAILMGNTKTVIADMKNIGERIFFAVYEFDRNTDEIIEIITMTENGPINGENFKKVSKFQDINGKVSFEAQRANDKWIVMTENGQVSAEFDSILKVFSQDGQAYVLGKIRDKIIRKHIPELSVKQEEEKLEREEEKIELNVQEKETLEMLNILKIGQNRPRWKKEMSEEEKERYGEFYDRFRELSKKFFQEDSRKIPFNSLLQEAVAGFSGKNKLYAQKNSADPKELLNDFKDAWLKQFIKPEQRREFERGISDFRRSFGDNNDFFNASDDPEMAFLDSFETAMSGGDPKMEGAEILENLDGYNGFLVKNNFSGGANGKFSRNNLVFLPEQRFRETEKFTFKVSSVPRKINQLNLPLPAESRLKGISGRNESGEVELENRGNRENILVDLDGNFQEIKYKVERNKLKCPIDAEMKWHELQKVYARLPESVTVDFSQHLFSLPVEMKEEMEKIKNLPIIEQVAALQKMAQDNFHYDMEYGSWRKSAGTELKRRMNKSQLQAIKHKKLFAGVCAEANLVMCQVLRQAGIMAGIAEGFMTDGKNIKNTHAHACTFAILPNERGEMEKYYIDGTPGGAVEGHLPSILEMQKNWEKSQEGDEKKITEETSKDLEKMVEYLEGELKLLNGDIEALLNGELKRVIAGGAEKLIDISQSLGIVRFSGLNLENLTKMEADVKGFFEKEMGNPRTRSLAKKEIEKNGKQAGEYVLEELKKTVDFLEKRFGLDKKQAREWFKNFNKNNLVEILSIEERALLNLAVDYIK